VLDFLRPGDTLTVTRVDRLARSIGDLQDIVRELHRKGVKLKATEQPIDTSTPAGKAFLDMLGVFAEFETNLRRERQMEDIAKAKAEGVYKGRPHRAFRPRRLPSSKLRAWGRARSHVGPRLAERVCIASSPSRAVALRSVDRQRRLGSGERQRLSASIASNAI
jgi:DNA invertase Pin-like site-specific DNA recombinase